MNEEYDLKTASRMSRKFRLSKQTAKGDADAGVSQATLSGFPNTLPQRKNRSVESVHWLNMRNDNETDLKKASRENRRRRLAEKSVRKRAKKSWKRKVAAGYQNWQASLIIPHSTVSPYVLGMSQLREATFFWNLYTILEFSHL